MNGPHTHTAGETFRERMHELWVMPLSFLGFALWRVWVSLSFANPAFPLQSPVPDKFVYDLCLAATALLLAACSNRLVPLSGRPQAYATCLATMTASALFMAWGLELDAVPTWLALCRDVLAGVGSALMILIWCELYATLSMVRVTVYLSLTFALGVLGTFLVQGFTPAYLQGTLVALPGLSLLCAWRSFALRIPETERPSPGTARPIPWKFLALLAVFGLLEGLGSIRLGGEYASLVGSHSTLARLVAALTLFVFAMLPSERLSLSVLYRSPAVLAGCGMLMVPLFGFGGSVAGAFCVSVSSSLFSSVVFLALCDASKRLGASALWLFGLEEATIVCRYAANLVEPLLYGGALGAYANSVVSVAGVALIAAFTALLLGKRPRNDQWAGCLIHADPLENPSPAQLLHESCERLAREHALSPRELEVLVLLAGGKSIARVAEELIIAEGTAKAHTQHIYEKTGVTRRAELLEKVQAAGLLN